MEETKIDLAELAKGWEKLHLEMKLENKFSFDLFDDVYTKTYEILYKQAEQTSIEKQYIAVIAKAFLFASADSADLECKYRAALVLTERMLNCCVLSSAPASPKGTMVYIFEIRKEVYVDFSNVAESLDTLEKLYDEEAWRKW